MIRLKPKQPLFLFLIAILAGGSMAIYSTSTANFWFKTIELIAFQHLGAIIIYFVCFWREILPR